jgi:hypothetical protein
MKCDNSGTLATGATGIAAILAWLALIFEQI